jgi:hypothetical protein
MAHQQGAVTKGEGCEAHSSPFVRLEDERPTSRCLGKYQQSRYPREGVTRVHLLPGRRIGYARHPRCADSKSASGEHEDEQKLARLTGEASS